MKFTLKYALFGAALSALGSTGVFAATSSAQAFSATTEAVSASPSAVVSIVQREVAANPGNACEIVRAAINAADAKPTVIAEIVRTAATAAPQHSLLIAQCAIAVAPDALTEVQEAYASLDAGQGVSYDDGAKGGIDEHVDPATLDRYMRDPNVESIEIDRGQPEGGRKASGGAGSDRVNIDSSAIPSDGSGVITVNNPSSTGYPNNPSLSDLVGQGIDRLTVTFKDGTVLTLPNIGGAQAGNPLDFPLGNTVTNVVVTNPDGSTSTITTPGPGPGGAAPVGPPAGGPGGPGIFLPPGGVGGGGPGGGGGGTGGGQPPIVTNPGVSGT